VIRIGKFIDLTGKKFNRWTVLKRAEDYVSPNGHHIIQWECICDCGKKSLVHGDSLRYNKSKSCGCYAEDFSHNSKNSYDLVGKKFHKLTVIKRVPPPETRKAKNMVYWMCHCECGNLKEVIANTSQLTSGNLKSCGCANKDVIRKKGYTNTRKLDLTGKTFERLYVVKEVERPYHLKKKREHYWLCKCSCGNDNTVVKNTYELTSGKAKSCGCLRKEIQNLPRSHNDSNKKQLFYELTGKYGVGYTYKGDVFYFDLEDYNKIKDYYWYIKDGYVITPKDSHTNQCYRMHRIVIEAPDGIQVDHINHNTFDNRKENLRLVSNQQNQMNRYNVKGIYWNNECNKWNAKIGFNGKSIDLGLYDDKNDAIKARKEAEEKYFGEYSYDNSMRISNNSVSKEDER
jgi:hypothetical protein